MKKLSQLVVAITTLFSTGLAYAEEAVVVAEPYVTPPTGKTWAEKKAGYALPYLLRPAIAPDLLRLDVSYAKQEFATTVVGMLTGGGKPFASVPDLGIYGRVAFVRNSPDSPGISASILSNPVLLGLYTPEVAPHMRLALFLGVALPIGGGGGNRNPDATTGKASADSLAARNAAASGIYARQAMDNAMFATNYITPTAGVGFAYIDKGLTLQAEATVLYLIRTRGDDLDTNGSRTNFTSGLSVGYQVLPILTVSAELHAQRWLSTPTVVEKNPEARSTLTAGLGVRFNVPLTNKIIIRPGLAYFHPLDEPMTASKYRIVMIDVPVAF